MFVGIDQQDIFDALAVFTAARKGHDIRNVNVEHNFDTDNGHSAVTTVGRHVYDFTEQDIRDAIIFYLADQHSYPADWLGVELLYNEVLDEKFARVYILRPDLDMEAAIATFERLTRLPDADGSQGLAGRERI